MKQFYQDFGSLMYKIQMKPFAINGIELKRLFQLKVKKQQIIQSVGNLTGKIYENDVNVILFNYDNKTFTSHYQNLLLKKFFQKILQKYLKKHKEYCLSFSKQILILTSSKINIQKQHLILEKLQSCFHNDKRRRRRRQKVCFKYFSIILQLKYIYWKRVSQKQKLYVFFNRNQFNLQN
ncbi:unnamed protein product [Paramecium pentaurelia]|nr:unnamed protein product [Paramecium pentaurelia]